MKLLFSTICFMFLLFFGCSNSTQKVNAQIRNPDGSLSPIIRAEVVSTQATRSLGLMYRKSMSETEGMLFVFPREQELSFWMKNTYLELDIIFIDKDWKVISIVERATPLSETARKSARPGQYVLEVSGGLAARWGVRSGSEVRVEGALPVAQ